jgi:hypothetical protein
MPNLFLDIETAPQFTKEEYFKTKEEIDSGKLNRHSENRDLFWRFDREGLTPFDGKVILITYKINNGHVFRLKEWADGHVSDKVFISGIQYLIENKKIELSDFKTPSLNPKEIPQWVKNIAGYWTNDMITDDNFISSIQYLVNNQIINP